MQTKTTRAFRTISEAGEELDLQPHVLRFWESKFSQIKPIKRGGGRRFYRPEDIEFLRGIKILLHDEGHPIKDVQKLIRLKGPSRVMELGQSVEKASREKKVKDTILIPERIRKSSAPQKVLTKPQTAKIEVETEKRQSSSDTTKVSVEPKVVPPNTEFTEQPVETPIQTKVGDIDKPQPRSVGASDPTPEMLQRKDDLEEALLRLKDLKSRWADFKTKPV